MKLSEAIEYATNHQNFLSFLKQRNIDPNSAHQILATISNVGNRFVENRIYIDFGAPGQSSNDVRVIVDYDKQAGNFNFIQVDHPQRTQ